jgi:hypothetical protein
MNRRIRRGAAVAGVAAVATLGLTALPAEAATTTPFTKTCYSVKNHELILTSFDFRITKMTLTDRKTGKRVNGWTGVVYQGRNSKKWSPKKTFPRGHVLDLVIKGHRMNAVGDTLNGCGLHS